MERIPTEKLLDLLCFVIVSNQVSLKEKSPPLPLPPFDVYHI